MIAQSAIHADRANIYSPSRTRIFVAHAQTDLRATTHRAFGPTASAHTNTGCALRCGRLACWLGSPTEHQHRNTSHNCLWHQQIWGWGGRLERMHAAALLQTNPSDHKLHHSNHTRLALVIQLAVWRHCSSATQSEWDRGQSNYDIRLHRNHIVKRSTLIIPPHQTLTHSLTCTTSTIHIDITAHWT